MVTKKTVYVTADGEGFTNENEARKHECYLDLRSTIHNILGKDQEQAESLDDAILEFAQSEDIASKVGFAFTMHASTLSELKLNKHLKDMQK
jgi:hypothetical protein